MMLTTMEKKKLVNVKNGKSYDYEILCLNISYLNEILQLNHIIMENLKDKSLHVPFTKEELKEILTGKGMILGVLVEKKLIGFRVLLWPMNSKVNLGYELGLDKENLNKVVHLEGTNIHPNFRGNGLQVKLTEISFQLLRQEKKWKHLLTMVSPYNFASLKNMFLVNMLIVRLNLKYDNYLRYVLYQNLKKPIRIDANTLIEVNREDFSYQKQLLSRGYYGFHQKITEEREISILFAKPSIISK